MTFLKNLHHFTLEDSHYVDGTNISKNSEKILNIVAKAFYYVCMVVAILGLCLGIFGGLFIMFKSLFNGYTDGFLLGIVAIIGAIIWAFLFYLVAIIYYSFLRMLTNISLSLKRLNQNPAVAQQPYQQPEQQQWQQPAQQQTNFYISCPDCGAQVIRGKKTCPECGCPLS